MKDPGKIFEADFIESLPSHVFRYRLRDPGRWKKGKEWDKDDKTRFTITNDCDFIIAFKKVYMVELKSFKGTSIPFGGIKQLDRLEKYMAYDDCEPVVIFNLRKHNETYVCKVKDLLHYRDIAGRKSVPNQWIMEHGEWIPQKLKRVHYKYDVMKWLEND